MIKVELIKTLPFIQILSELKNKNPDLPDLYEDLWRELAHSYYGNQTFHNDSFFRYWWDTGDEYALSDNMNLLIEFCRELSAINTYEGCDGESNFIVFDVCW